MHTRTISWGCAAQAPGSNEQLTQCQVGWSTLITPAPELFTAGNSGEVEALQNSFPSPLVVLSAFSGSESVAGFHPVIDSIGSWRIPQES